MSQNDIRLVKARSPHYPDPILQCRRGERLLAEIRCHMYHFGFDVVHLVPLDGIPDANDLQQVRAIIHAMTRPSTTREEQLRARVMEAMRYSGISVLDFAAADYLNPQTEPSSADLSGLRGVTECVADQGDCIQVFTRAIERVRLRDNAVIAMGMSPDDVSSDGNMRVRLTVQGEHRFSFWKMAFVHSIEGRDSLNIVPPYHPAIAKNKTDAWMVNGATSALIGIDTLRYLLPPKGAFTRADIFAHGGTGWAGVSHPWKVEGTDFGLVIDPFVCRTSRAVDDLTNLIRCALGLDEKHYVAINGGFHPPLAHATNVQAACHHLLNEGSGLRGSEDHCLWTYRVLAEEGQLAGARIPDWFKTERWLELDDRYGQRR